MNTVALVKILKVSLPTLGTDIFIILVTGKAFWITVLTDVVDQNPTHITVLDTYFILKFVLGCSRDTSQTFRFIPTSTG